MEWIGASLGSTGSELRWVRLDQSWVRVAASRRERIGATEILAAWRRERIRALVSLAASRRERRAVRVRAKLVRVRAWSSAW